MVEKDFAWWDKYDILLDQMRDRRLLLKQALLISLSVLQWPELTCRYLACRAEMEGWREDDVSQT